MKIEIKLPHHTNQPTCLQPPCHFEHLALRVRIWNVCSNDDCILQAAELLARCVTLVYIATNGNLRSLPPDMSEYDVIALHTSTLIVKVFVVRNL